MINNYTGELPEYSKDTYLSSGSNFQNNFRISIFYFDNYKLEIILDPLNRFIGIKSIQVNKNFYDTTKLAASIGDSAEDILNEYYKKNEQGD